MSWNSYFMSIAKQAATASKDTSTKVGAVLVAPDNTIVSTGFNGFVAGADESLFTWDRPKKHLLVIHAELNAILFAKRDLTGCRAYTTEAPCENCLKHLLQAKVREIYYESAVVMTQRSTAEQKEAIKALINATGAKVENINGKKYLEELLAQPD